ncbi:MAG: ArgE/DapE family deacylase [Chloroflexota bacterium]|nr:ArgE/DapE family deacylase [Chloroflexota bacterium]
MGTPGNTAEVGQGAPEAAVRRLWNEIEAREDELIETIAELVRHPSLLGEEAAAQAYVAGHLRASGLETEVWDLDDGVKELPNGGDSGVPFVGRPNVTAALRGVGGGRSLILNGHVDVVSPEPVAAWSHDPWAAEVVGDRMYGRGAYDMKSGLALNLLLPRLLRDLGIGLRGDLLIHSVIEEECTGNGALAASLRPSHGADAAVVTEPTGGAFTAAHVGVLWFRIALEGVSWHAMQAYRGVNAIAKAVPVIQALEALDHRLNERPPHPAFVGVEHPINLNVGVIRGGDWPSTVPGACELHCRLAVYPGQEVAEARAEIEAAVAGAASADPWLREHPPRVTYDGFRSAGSVVSMDEPSVRLLGSWHERVAGEAMRPVSGTGINDMRYYNFVGIPAGCYGARGGNGHAADEWLDLPSLVPTAKVLGAFLLDWCGLAD